MKHLQNLGIGFLVSFIGSIPMGYLNIVGFHVYQSFGLSDVIFYLSGVIIVEAIVIYLTLIFASNLAQNKRMLKYLELFSTFFMLALAYIFYAAATSSINEEVANYPRYSPIILGITLSAMNFIQLPFWVGWNLYLINNSFISAKKPYRFFYLGGTLMGTFAGMLLFILFLDFVMIESGGFSKYLMLYVIPAVFSGLAFFQAFKYYRKWHSAKQ